MYLFLIDLLNIFLLRVDIFTGTNIYKEHGQLGAIGL